jgi:putative flippase GtrA
VKASAPRVPLLRQAVRYGVAGVLNNLLGYLIYLLMTYFGVDPKIAVTVLYPISAATGYFAHFRYSFSYRKGHAGAALRYALAHCAGYGVNVAMLYIFSDMLKFPHQAVQAAAIFVVAGVLFLVFRYFVFAHADPGLVGRSSGERETRARDEGLR